MRMKQHINISLSLEGAALLEVLAARLGVNRSAIVDLALRRYAVAEGVPLPEPPPVPARKTARKQARPKAGQ